MDERPRRRGDCVDGPRPCPWVSCRYHLAHERIKRLDEDAAVEAITETMTQTCALDLADDGNQDWQIMSTAMAVSRPMLILNCWIALAKIRETTAPDDWDVPAERDDGEHSTGAARRDRSRKPQ